MLVTVFAAGEEAIKLIPFFSRHSFNSASSPPPVSTDGEVELLYSGKIVDALDISKVSSSFL